MEIDKRLDHTLEITITALENFTFIYLLLQYLINKIGMTLFLSFKNFVVIKRDLYRVERKTNTAANSEEVRLLGVCGWVHAHNCTFFSLGVILLELFNYKDLR